MSKIDKILLLAMVKQGASQAIIAQRFNCSRVAVCKMLKRIERENETELTEDFLKDLWDREFQDPVLGPIGD